MPSKTFLNLNKEKKERIIKAGLYEFALNRYKVASLSKIVKKANISKGSIYRYFDNKKDFYLFLVDIAVKKKLDYIERNLEKDLDFFKKIKQINLIGLEFDLTYLEYSGLISHFTNETTTEEIKDEIKPSLKKTREFVKKYILKAKREGVIKKDIDVDLVTFLIIQISISIHKFLESKYNFDYYELISKNKDISFKKIEINKELDKLIDVLKNGLSN
ncbi:MAG: TetR/AcrR family transcriptional regulator [Bacillota bacterium]